jgi:hypothetical protein
VNSSPSRRNESESRWRRPSPRSGIAFDASGSAAFFEGDFAAGFAGAFAAALAGAFAAGLATGFVVGFFAGFGAGFGAGFAFLGGDGRDLAFAFAACARAGFAFDANGEDLGRAPPTPPIYWYGTARAVARFLRSGAKIIWRASLRRSRSLPTGSRTGMERADLAWLGSGILLVVFVALDPLLAFPVFGSDTGEYYSLTSALLRTGHLPTTAAYAGWGFAYSAFPGLFELSAATAGATGTPVLTALQLVGPVVAALAIVPLFLLFRRLVPNDTVAILGAVLGSLFMPRIYSVAHPAPLALGEALGLAALWMLVETRRDARWYLPLGVTGAALVITHHLSSYFFVVGALGLIVLTELLWPGRWSRRFPVVELGFLAAFLGGAFVYWFDYSGSFSTIVGGGVAGIPLSLPLVETGTVGGFLMLGLLLWARRRWARPRRRRAKFPSDPSVLRDAVILLVGIYGGLGLLLVHPLPGSTQTTTASALVFFTPLLLLIVATSGSRRLLGFARDGPLALAWIAAIGLSALFALLIGVSNPNLSEAISPIRHAEYLVIPLGLIVAVCLGRLVGLGLDRHGRPVAIALGVGIVVLVGANAAIAYPPPADFGGFQEGLTNGDAAVWMWTGIAVPPSAVVASDHRVSSMVFGFDGNPATWDSTPALFTGSNWSDARAELVSSLAPHVLRPISVVIVDGTMRTSGVALDPSQLASPMSANATAWFGGPPFVALYENGGTTVYWVDLSAGPT